MTAIHEFIKIYHLKYEWKRMKNLKSYANWHDLATKEIGFDVLRGHQSASQFKIQLSKDFRRFYCNLLRSSVNLLYSCCNESIFKFFWV